MKFALCALDASGKVWALPYTCLGVAYGLLGHAYGLPRSKDPGVSLGNNAIQFTGNPFVRRNAAFTLGNVIVFGAGSGPSMNGCYGDSAVNVGRHEQAHTLQYQALGLFFPPAYILAGGFSVPAGNAFERAAQLYATGQGSWWPWPPKRSIHA